jgi:hypothetical protein
VLLAAPGVDNQEQTREQIARTPRHRSEGGVLRRVRRLFAGASARSAIQPHHSKTACAPSSLGWKVL